MEGGDVQESTHATFRLKAQFCPTAAPDGPQERKHPKQSSPIKGLKNLKRLSLSLSLSLSLPLASSLVRSFERRLCRQSCCFLAASCLPLSPSLSLSHINLEAAARSLGASQTKRFRPLLDVFFPSIYRIFRASHNATNRWCIINQMFANSLPVDARVKNIR